MKKKVFISILTFVFFLSTTSIPMSIHMCKMMEDVSAETCGMCSSGMNTGDEDMHLKRAASSSCCSTKIIDNTVKDNFLSNKTSTEDISSVKYINTVTEEVISSSNISSYIDKDTSPPRLDSNELYLFNSILLI